MTRAQAGLMLGALLIASLVPPHAAPARMQDCGPASVSSGASPCHHATPQSCERTPGCAGLSAAVPSVAVAAVAAPAATLVATPDARVPAGRLQTGPPTPPPNS